MNDYIDDPAMRRQPGASSSVQIRAGAVDFDAFYAGTPPWDVSHPQPAFAELAAAGALIGHVLDAGCGTGEHALMAAELGHHATGVDVAPRAIARAEQKARQRGLLARFEVGDARALASLGRWFDTVLDSGLFHVFDDVDRARYVEALAAVVPAGGQVHLLCFSEHVPGDSGPRRVTQEEIRSSFARGWRVVLIRPRVIVATLNPGGVPGWCATVTRT